MMHKVKKTGLLLVAALTVSSAALLTWGAEPPQPTKLAAVASNASVASALTIVVQEPAAKTNQRGAGQGNGRREENKRPPDATQYSYEFTQPQFYIRHILIEHNAAGEGKITFERLGETTSISEPLELSIGALGRILGLWSDLHFLDSSVAYQAAKQFPHLGTMRLHMENGAHQRTAEFNWTNDKAAAALISEYRRAADQAIFVFDLSIARENQPLNTPKLMETLESMLSRGGLSDPYQLVPLLQELTTDEHVPLIARNHAGRLLKRLEK